jgi:hypothetical protein
MDIREVELNDIDWIYLAPDWDQRHAVANAKMSHRVRQR